MIYTSLKNKMKIPSVNSCILSLLKKNPNKGYTTNQIYKIIKKDAIKGLCSKSQAVSSRCSKLFKNNKIFRSKFIPFKYSFNDLNIKDKNESKNNSIRENNNLLNEIKFKNYDENIYGPLNFYNFNKNLKEIFIEYIDCRGIKDFNYKIEDLEEIILTKKKKLFYYNYNNYLIKFKCTEQDSTILTYILSIN